ncbi:MAG: hypothetical protein IT289_12915 [Oligoflexia bacterium]|nr:hypothetical protein [Oligoflexia bacterium]
MSEFFSGSIQFFELLFFLLVTLELNAFVERFLNTKLNFKVGDLGARSGAIGMLARQLLILLRRAPSMKDSLTGALKLSSLFLMMALLPGPGGTPVVDFPHSLWVFFLTYQLMPVVVFVISLGIFGGRAWPGVVSQVERAQGALAAVLALGLTIMGLTGSDQIGQIYSLQQRSGWLIFQSVGFVPVMLCFLCLVAYLSAQNLFSRDSFKGLNESIISTKIEGMLLRFIWCLFVADIFLGGAGETLGWVGLFGKVVFLNAVLELFTSGFIRVREDQAERFILWQFTPFCLLIFILTLLGHGVMRA